MFRNTCANGKLLNKSKKYDYFKGVAVLQKQLIKRINRNSINSVKSWKLLYKCNQHERLYTSIYIQVQSRIIFDSLHILKEYCFLNDKGGVK